MDRAGALPSSPPPEGKCMQHGPTFLTLQTNRQPTPFRRVVCAAIALLVAANSSAIAAHTTRLNGVGCLLVWRVKKVGPCCMHLPSGGGEEGSAPALSIPPRLPQSDTRACPRLGPGSDPAV